MRLIIAIFLISIWLISFGQQNTSGNDRYRYELIPFLTDKGYGYMDRDGNIAIEPQYERASLFDSVGLAIVSMGGKEGLIDEDGEMLVPCIFDSKEYRWSTKQNYARIKTWNGETKYDSTLRFFHSPFVDEYFFYKIGSKRKTSKVCIKSLPLYFIKN
jgi:hypothetical protein